MIPTIISPPYPPPVADFTNRAVLDITQRVIHHSAGPITQTPLDIDAFERQRSDHFIYIPYSFLMGPTNGDYTKPVLYRGRPYLTVEGATFGEHPQSLSICLLGNFEKNDSGYTGPPTEELWDLLYVWCVYTQGICPGISRTVGHNKTAIEQGYTDQCPGSDIIDGMSALLNRVYQGLRHR